MKRERVIFRLILALWTSTSLSACTGFNAQLTQSPPQESEAQRLLSSQQALLSPACQMFLQAAPSSGDVSTDLQGCIETLASGEVLALKPGVYHLNRSIYLKSGVTLTTQGNPKCTVDEKHACAELKAMPDARPDYVTGLVGVLANAKLLNVVVNGNRQARTGSRYADLCRSGTTIAQNMKIEGDNITVDGVVIKNALCAAGAVVLPGADNLTFQNNTVAFNGTHDENLMWADGLTVIDAKNSRFINNVFIDNTDVDMIFGGCSNCVIQKNSIVHGPSFAGSTFAALMLHAWPAGGSSGDYTNADISSNSIDCGPMRRCGFGLLLGAEPWYSAPLFGGFVHDNSITNALQGFHVEKASGPIRIKNNIVTNSGGRTLTQKGVRIAAPYAIADRTYIQIEDTTVNPSAYLSMSFAGAIANWWTADMNFAVTGSSESSEDLIAKAYREILKREPDVAGLQHYLQRIAEGASVAQVRAEIQASAEGLVRAAYRELLKREADDVGLKYFIGKLANGASIESIRAEIESSAEFRAGRK